MAFKYFRFFQFDPKPPSPNKVQDPLTPSERGALARKNAGGALRRVNRIKAAEARIRKREQQGKSIE